MDYQAIAAEYLAGTSRRKLAGKYGCSPGLINHILKKVGCTLSEEERAARRAVSAHARNICPRPRRKIPDDFATVAPVNTRDQMMSIYRCSPSTLARWLAETGITPGKTSQTFLPVPADFAKLAPTMMRKDLKAHYRVAHDTLSRWYREANAAKKCPAQRSVPEDFADRAAKMTKTGLVDFYKTGRGTVERWVKETGVRPLLFNPHVGHPGMWRTRNNITPFMNRRPASIFDDAADILRRFGPVYRCTEKGVGDHAGKFWRIGNVVVTPDELLQRADAKRAKVA